MNRFITIKRNIYSLCSKNVLSDWLSDESPTEPSFTSKLSNESLFIRQTWLQTLDDILAE